MFLANNRKDKTMAAASAVAAIASPAVVDVVAVVAVAADVSAVVDVAVAVVAVAAARPKPTTGVLFAVESPSDVDFCSILFGSNLSSAKTKS